MNNPLQSHLNYILYRFGVMALLLIGFIIGVLLLNYCFDKVFVDRKEEPEISTKLLILCCVGFILALGCSYLFFVFLES